MCGILQPGNRLLWATLSSGRTRLFGFRPPHSAGVRVVSPRRRSAWWGRPHPLVQELAPAAGMKFDRCDSLFAPTRPDPLARGAARAGRRRRARRGAAARAAVSSRLRGGRDRRPAVSHERDRIARRRARARLPPHLDLRARRARDLRPVAGVDRRLALVDRVPRLPRGRLRRGRPRDRRGGDRGRRVRARRRCGGDARWQRRGSRATARCGSRWRRSWSSRWRARSSASGWAPRRPSARPCRTPPPPRRLARASPPAAKACAARSRAVRRRGLRPLPLDRRDRCGRQARPAPGHARRGPRRQPREHRGAARRHRRRLPGEAHAGGFRANGSTRPSCARSPSS